MQSLIATLLFFTLISADVLADLSFCPQNQQQLFTAIDQFSNEISSQVLNHERWDGSVSWERYTDWIKSCGQQINSLDKNQCTANFQKYVTQKSKILQNTMGFPISATEYIKSQPAGAADIPEEMKDGLKPGWRERANKLGWKYIEFFSPSVGFYNPEDPHTAYRRLVFYIPNDKGFQKWIQFVPPQTQNNNVDHVYHVDIIAVDKDENGNNRQHHNQVIRNSLDEPFVQKLYNQVSKCIACHANGPRVIRPWAGYVTEGNISAKGMAEIIYKAQNSNWGDAIDLTAMGPAIGQNQTCTNCHDPNNYGTYEYDQAGFLHDAFALGQIYSKMVETMVMPPPFLKQEKFKDLKALIDRMENLPAKDAKKIQGTENRNYETLIEAMLSAKLISSAEYKKVSEQLEVARNEAETNYENLRRDQKSILKKWLDGDCEKK